MSSSKGVGSSAKEMADLLPPELLRFLMLRTQPRSVINFAPNYETITRLFRDYDTLIEKYAAEEKAKGGKPELNKDFLPLFYSQVGDEIKTYYPFDFSTLISLLQIPHIDIKEEVAKRAAVPLTEYDWEVIEKRIEVARKWLEDYADEEEKLVIYFERVPEKAKELSPEQVSYLAKLAENLERQEVWEGETLQTLLFSTAKELPIEQGKAFPAFYLSFLNKERGPKAGYLLSYLQKKFALARLREVIAINTKASAQ